MGAELSLHEPGLRLLIRVGRYQPLNGFECIDLARPFIRPEAQDPGKTEGVTAFVAFGFLDPVKGHFNDRLWFD
jgi:hypothetical protein